VRGPRLDLLEPEGERDEHGGAGKANRLHDEQHDESERWPPGRVGDEAEVRSGRTNGIAAQRLEERRELSGPEQCHEHHAEAAPDARAERRRQSGDATTAEHRCADHGQPDSQRQSVSA
jgi:hypothetical protein